MESVSSKHNTT